MLHGTEPVDVFFGPIAEPDFCLFDDADYTDCKVRSAAKDIAFLYMHRPIISDSLSCTLQPIHTNEVDSGPQTSLSCTQPIDKPILLLRSDDLRVIQPRAMTVRFLREDDLRLN